MGNKTNGTSKTSENKPESDMSSRRTLRSVIIPKDDLTTFKVPTSLKTRKQKEELVDSSFPPVGSSKIQEIFSESHKPDNFSIASSTDHEYLSANDSSHDRSQIDNEVMELLDNSEDEYFNRALQLSPSEEGSPSNSPPKTAAQDFANVNDSSQKKRKAGSQLTSGEKNESENKKARQYMACSTKNQDDNNNKVVYPSPSKIKQFTASQEWLNLGLKANLLYKLCGPNYNALNKPVGVAQLPTGEVVVADTFNDRMVLFSSEGKFKDSFSSPNMKRPAALVALKTGNFIVKDHYSIDHFDGACNYIGPLYHSALLKKPYGLAQTDQGKIITMETGKEGFISLVIMDIFAQDNIIRMLVNLKLSSREAEFSKPRFLTHQGGNMVLVVDLGLNCVYRIEYDVHLAQGEVLKRIGRKGKKNGEFHDPSGVVVDEDKFILVGDSKNHRIQLFDPEGEFLSGLKFDVPLKRPSGIFLTNEGELLVINYWENNVAKYRLSMG
ncbi:unnamed protein product [Meganyctiphanes norvegica]|uniref:Uncharacterized protein n=1 Tax=Meganyctiphanes norvegica TaxID=48144 RepID=A0AAV2QLH6_MEGNR